MVEPIPATARSDDHRPINAKEEILEMSTDPHMTKSEATKSAASWDLRHPGLIMTGSNGAEVHEFTGMWPLKPDADLMAFTNGLSREAPFWAGPGRTFSEATTALGLIRTARWFIGNSTEFGPTLYFVSQFDSSLEKYFDDFVLNGRTNLEKIWGQCIGCPTGPDATARDIVQYVARGQIKTLACYDAFPSLSNNQIEKQADWYAKTQKFQRAISKVSANLEAEVDAFLSELAKPYEHVPSGAAIDTDACKERQFSDVPERLGVQKAA
jgi:hypothetical protein